jgi:hypothetical protein
VSLPRFEPRTPQIGFKSLPSQVETRGITDNRHLAATDSGAGVLSPEAQNSLRQHVTANSTFSASGWLVCLHVAVGRMLLEF